MGEGQREKERELQLQAGSTIPAWNPIWSSTPRTVRSEPKPRVRCLTKSQIEPPGAPRWTCDGNTGKTEIHREFQ